jgi:hypothetical protein
MNGNQLIISGDSDFISVAQKLRALGKTIIGIGTRESTNKYWSLACSNFKYYEDLVPKTPVRPAPAIPASKPAQTVKPTQKPVAKPQVTKKPSKKLKKTPQWLLREGVTQLLKGNDKAGTRYDPGLPA